MLIENPSDSAAFRSRGEATGERSTHDLLECEVLGGSGVG